ncbi:gliding motility lipoprotein GldD [Muricauda sp. SCSIO 64092]|uniref:gliding motility lipoprotein GldD n=1 Tax=Allomuricauda sp. SCSIO 64092 TaxID=2908842 RepID=UPI001FF53FC2|nr:gliding motility lipoprotein GldD [Muricauda sp. SCSIO 64092]UOY04713.1 gliding motility lipoprotein GldD [Muricauda sp. SCSIO 64092]
MGRNPMLFLLFLMLWGCGEHTIPKPKAMLRLEFPNGEYKEFGEEGCEFGFAKNELSFITAKNDCSMVLDYPMMKGSIYLTYKPVDNNLNTLLTDAQRLSYEHVVKADNIIEQPFVNTREKVYGMFYEVTGNAASQSQFYVTDSINHFVTGSLYFYAKPNYDSIYPAAVYLQKDIRRIMESLHW